MAHVISFGEGPKVEPVVKSEVWRLTEDFCCRVDDTQIIVPKGFLTDGASIPRFLWRICGHPMTTKRFPIAVVHDFIYSLGDKNRWGYTRADADGIYRDGLVVLEFSKWKANTEYYAIKFFGGSHWGDC